MEPLTPTRLSPWRWLAVVVVVLLVGIAAGSFYLHRVLYQPLLGSADPLLVIVKPGDTPGLVLQRLEKDGHLVHSRVLRIWTRFQDRSRLHAGEYEIPVGAPAVEVISRLLSGRTVQRSFVIIEGWNIHQLRVALAQETRLRDETGALSDAALMARLGKPGLHPEGRFAPDTYFFSPHSSSDFDLLRRAFVEQERRLAAAWAERAADLPYRNADALLIMASIVEKETGQASERPAIAGVFVRRLKIGMRLQTDPTVIYGLGAAYAGNITRAHLLQPTPWNTYVIDGLPPTPIAMPGDAALRAAAHPADGTALYFVGRGDGSHQFSSTFEAHNAAVREYQLRRRVDYRSAPAPAPAPDRVAP